MSCLAEKGVSDIELMHRLSTLFLYELNFKARIFYFVFLLTFCFVSLPKNTLYCILVCLTFWVFLEFTYRKGTNSFLLKGLLVRKKVNLD